MAKVRIDHRDISTTRVLELLLDHFPDMLHSVDAQGRLVYANRKAESLLGYTRAELLAMDVRQIYAAEVLPDVEKGFADLKATGVKQVESVVCDRHGNRIPVEVRSFSVYDDAGRFLHTFSILRDIRPLKELQAAMVHAGRLAAVGELAAGVMHDIANPLSVVVMANEMCARVAEELEAKRVDSTLAEQLRMWLEHIEKASGSIHKLVDHMRNFSRSHEHFGRTDLGLVVEDALFIAQNRIQKTRVAVANRIPAKTHFVHGAHNRLEQVFVNLITNACDAMEGRPERVLTLTIAAGKAPDGVPCWRCDVADTGHGVPPEIMEEIFTPFFTTKEKGKGTGLGLSITRGILKDHKGEVTVRSEPGKGAVFSIRIPRLD
jgi:PAS domain S-box-containing protein